MTSFQTRVGERVLRPSYGCKLWQMIFEPLTPTMRENIIAEAIRICNLDQRCVTKSVQVFELEQGFRIEVVLQYLPWRVIGTFAANFERNEQTYFNIG
jgi:phage baseplate assembly protein W